MIFVEHQIIKFLNTLPHRLRSQPRQNKDSEFKSTDIKDLDTRNLRDVQLTEYEKRKAQMKELDRYYMLCSTSSRNYILQCEAQSSPPILPLCS